ncbi:MAG: NAD(P)(+) transhydrogenase (Re/Si-specific) subunit beta, partial [Microvirgula sp.]
MENITAILYLIAAICFILALKGLSSPKAAQRGNFYGIAGMAIAFITTLALADKPIWGLMGGAVIIGGLIGGTL